MSEIDNCCGTTCDKPVAKAEYEAQVAKVADLEAQVKKLAAHNDALVRIVLQLRDRWWPFVHGAACASDAAVNLLKKSADVLNNKSDPQYVRDIQADAIEKASQATRVSFSEGGPQWLCRVTDLQKYAGDVRRGEA